MLRSFCSFFYLIQNFGVKHRLPLTSHSLLVTRSVSLVAMEKFRASGTNLESLTKEDLRNWVNAFDTVLTDCDGVLWVYSDVLENSPEVINKFSKLGKKIFFVTNNSTKTREEFLEKALAMKYDVTRDGVLSTAYLVAQYLKEVNFTKKVFIVGSSGIAKELDAVGISHTDVGPDVLKTNVADLVKSDFKPDPEVGAVVVGFDEHFSFPKMFKAGSYLSNPDVLFVATNTDERFPMPNFVVPGTGTMVRAVEVCAERKAFIIGKPNPYICDHITTKYGINPSRTLMIGDRCNTDILLGKNCGFFTLLVETGIHDRAYLEKCKESDDAEMKKMIPDFYIKSLGALLPRLNEL